MGLSFCLLPAREGQELRPYARGQTSKEAGCCPSWQPQDREAPWGWLFAKVPHTCPGSHPACPRSSTTAQDQKASGAETPRLFTPSHFLVKCLSTSRIKWSVLCPGLCRKPDPQGQPKAIGWTLHTYTKQRWLLPAVTLPPRHDAGTMCLRM